MAKKSSSKFIYILIGVIIGVALSFGAMALFLRWKISTYEKEFSQIDTKIEEAINRLDLPRGEKKVKRVGFMPAYSYAEQALSIPFDYSLDELTSRIRKEFSLKPIKIYQIEERNLEDSYQVLVELGNEERVTHTLKFVLEKVKIALLIDDFGYSKGEAVDVFLKNLDFPLTISVIPGTKYATLIAEEAHKSGKEVIVHLPMQAQREDLNHGYKWIILEKMGEGEIKLATEEAIKSIPYAVGLNNHMGSLITTKEEPMRALLGVVKKEGLFFVDSKTTADSIAFSLAKELGIKCAYREVFLDNEENVDYIKKQFQELISQAREKGKVIGLGHVNIITVQAIEEILSGLEKRKIDLVYISEIVE